MALMPAVQNALSDEFGVSHELFASGPQRFFLRSATINIKHPLRSWSACAVPIRLLWWLSVGCCPCRASTSQVPFELLPAELDIGRMAHHPPMVRKP